MHNTIEKQKFVKKILYSMCKNSNIQYISSITNYQDVVSIYTSQLSQNSEHTIFIVDIPKNFYISDKSIELTFNILLEDNFFIKESIKSLNKKLSKISNIT